MKTAADTPGLPSAGRSFRQGFWDTIPALLAIVPFGLASGVAAVAAGLSETMALGMSVIIFAGSAQLAMCQLIGLGAPLGVIVASAVVLNLRFVMYSATLAPFYTKLPLWRRLLIGYTMSDQGFAMSINRYLSGSQTDRAGWYLLGTGALLWPVWVAATAVGIWLGASVPASWSLDYSIWLIFLCLARVSVRDRRPEWWSACSFR